MVLTQLNPEPASYKAKYFRNGNNITAEIMSGGKTFRLADGQKKVFEMKLERTGDVPEGACYLVEAAAIDLGDDDTATIKTNDADC